MERLGEQHQIECAALRLPVLEGGHLHLDALRGGHLCHPGIRFDGEHLRAGRRQLRRRDPGARSDVQHTRPPGHELSDERLWIARAVPVVRAGGTSERLGPAAVGVHWLLLIRHTASVPGSGDLSVGAVTVRSNPKEPLKGLGGAMLIDCDDCAMRGPGCDDCVVSVLLGIPQTLADDERAALAVLAEAGMAPKLRLVPIQRTYDTPVSAKTPDAGVA